MEQQGQHTDDGGWQASEGSPFRSLTDAEVADLQRMAESTDPSFGPGDAPWEMHHPIARAIWQRRGFGPKG